MSEKSAPEMRLHEIKPSPDWAGSKLKTILRESVPGLSSRAAVMAVVNGLVRRGDRVLDDLDHVPGELGGPITVDLRHGLHGKGTPKKTPLVERIRVVHDDDHLVVVDKAAGILVQPADRDEDDSKSGPPLVELLKHYWRLNKEPQINPVVVHRLDRETSGLLVLAKTVECGRRLQVLLRDRKVRRVYRAVVQGRMESLEGRWRSYLGRNEKGLRASVDGGIDPRPPAQKPRGPRPGLRRRSDADAPPPPPPLPRVILPRGAQEATTRYRVAQAGRGVTLLELELETGRTHQIRIHCAEALHPVVGDRLYPPLAADVRERLAAGRLLEAAAEHPYAEARAAFVAGAKESRAHAPRLCLHAVRLEFRHPFSKELVRFESEAPAMFDRVVRDGYAEQQAADED